MIIKPDKNLHQKGLYLRWTEFFGISMLDVNITWLNTTKSIFLYICNQLTGVEWRWGGMKVCWYSTKLLFSELPSDQNRHTMCINRCKYGYRFFDIIPPFSHFHNCHFWCFLQSVDTCFVVHIHTFWYSVWQLNYLPFLFKKWMILMLIN